MLHYTVLLLFSLELHLFPFSDELAVGEYVIQHRNNELEETALHIDDLTLESPLDPGEFDLHAAISDPLYNEEIRYLTRHITH
jgi:hypothetical protein